MAGSAYGVQRFFSVASIAVTIFLLFTLHNTLSPHLNLAGETTIAEEIRHGVLTSDNVSVTHVGGGVNSKLFVVIVAGFRTGSTLLGEIFNQNPDVNYIFEPFHQGYLKTGVKDLPNYRPEMTQEELQIFYLENLINNCTSYFPRYFLRQMKSLHCKNEGESIDKYGNSKCEPPKQIITDRCFKLDTTVAKAIRIREISKLSSISNIKNLNVKVIHLVRDPRGTFNSRCHGFPKFYLHDIKEIPVEPITNDKARLVAQDYCGREVVNLRFTDDHMPGWLDGKYLRLTHSQISLDPLGNAEKVYKFLGLELPQSVRQWAIDQQSLEGEHGGLLSTKKDAQLVLNKWREVLKPEWVQTIQNECRELMLRLNMTLV